jgi:hypothetical protein
MTTHKLVAGLNATGAQIVNLRCPHCHHAGAFHGIGNCADLVWSESGGGGAQQYAAGMRKYPNPDWQPSGASASLPSRFGCDANSQCSITCYFGSQQKTFSNLQWAVVYNYPNSTRLWLYAGGPNDQFLLGESFCNFSKIYKVWPL